MFVRSWMVPVVLAGLRSEERMLIGHREDPSSILRPDNKREWCVTGCRIIRREINPLGCTANLYAVNFPVRPPSNTFPF
jgi:hypothetical protein